MKNTLKSKYVIAAAIIIIALIIIFAVVKAAKRPRSVDMTGLTYEQLCKSNGDQWMVMEPWKDGKQVSSEKCAGCMIADNHLCNAEEYIGYIKTLPGFNEISTEMGTDSHKMSKAR